MQQGARSNLSRVIDGIEETLIAIILGLMTLITFVNVIARYIFNDNILWALEATVFLFAWLVLIGASYGVKHSLHLGVDVLINSVSPPMRRVLGLIAVSACLVFTILMFIGCWEYWYDFATRQAFYETNDIPMPEFLQFLADWVNDGERYEKMPRFIPYAVLPISMALLTFRYLQAGYRVLTGRIDRVIAAHEAEETLEQLTQDKKENS